MGILALGLTETGGFGNTFPPTADSAYDYIPGYAKLVKRFKEDKELESGWAKNHSPSLLWLNKKSREHQAKIMEKGTLVDGGVKNEQWTAWNDVNKDILFNWNLNMDKLMCEVLETKAVILTFQEVDTFRAGGVYSLQERMAKLGYEGIHQQKMGNGNGLFGYVDGPAIFWDANKFERAGPMEIITFESKYKYLAEKCSKCDSKGKVDGKECSKCDGKGTPRDLT